MSKFDEEHERLRNKAPHECIGIGPGSVAIGYKCSCGVDKNGKKLWCFLHNKISDIDEIEKLRGALQEILLYIEHNEFHGRSITSEDIKNFAKQALKGADNE